MAQDISLQGATYYAVPAVTLPKDGGGTASFTDVTDTTASASDVASGKYFYTAAGVKTAGTSSGGGITLKMGVLRPDATLVQSYSYDKYIKADENINIPAYTTSATTLKASAELSPTVSLDLSNYNYYVLIRHLSIPTYSVSTKGKGRLEYSLDSELYEITEYPANTFSAIIDSTKKVTTRDVAVVTAGRTPRIVYYSSSTALSVYAATTYGPNQSEVAPSLSGTTLTLKSPNLTIRGNTTYYSQTYMNATTDARYQYRIEVYRAPKGNLNLDGWGVFQQMEHVVDCLNNGGTLT